MPPAFFSSPLLFVKVGLRHRSCACTLQHAVPRAEALFQFPVIQDICLHGLSAVFLSEVSDKLQEFFVCHFFIWCSNLIQLLDFLCCCQVRIVLYALFYFSLIHLLPSLVSMLPFVPAGGVTCRHRPVRMKRIFSIKKTMIVLTIAFVSCISWLRSGMKRYADRKLSPCCQFFVSGFVGLLTYPFMCEGFPSHKRIVSAFSPGHDSPSNDRFSPHAGIPRMENNTLESQLLSEPCRALAISNVQTVILRWIPSVSGIFTRFPCSANKHACPISRVAHLPQKPCYLVYYLRTCFSARKKTSPALLSRRQKKSRVLCIFSFGVRKNYLFI